jgi:exopolysaccharide biosynthesis predicted pyruvyltransferase EpsI
VAFKNLKGLLATACGPFFMIEPGGNYGDQLIYLGAEKLVRDVGVDYHRMAFDDVEHSEIPKGAWVYIHGGGGYNRWTSGRAFGAFEWACRIPGVTVIQGPQTVDGETDYWKSRFSELGKKVKCKEVFFFTREHQSNNLMRSLHENWFSLFLEHDTALYLKCPDLSSLLVERSVRHLYKLWGIRSDNEATLESLNCGLLGRDVCLDPPQFASSFLHWLRLHACASSIVTNRTHSSIAGSILGVPTTLFGGSYHKNRSIWEFSLRDRGVLWADEISTPSAGALNQMLQSVACKSWKVSRIACFLKGVPLR